MCHENMLQEFWADVKSYSPAEVEKQLSWSHYLLHISRIAVQVICCVLTSNNQTP